MTYDQRLMDRAIAHAKANPIVSKGRTSISRMGALLVGNNVLQYYGHNKYKSHPLALKFSKDHNKICLHAEMDALIKLLQNFHYSYHKILEDIPFDIYVARVLKNNQTALAKPCPACLGALSYFQIRNIYWTT